MTFLLNVFLSVLEGKKHQMHLDQNHLLSLNQFLQPPIQVWLQCNFALILKLFISEK